MDKTDIVDQLRLVSISDFDRVLDQRRGQHFEEDQIKQKI